MSKRPLPSATFADIVRAVKESPPAAAELLPDLRAPGGRRFYETGRELDPAEALHLVTDGSLVAWDSCGGRGAGGAGPVSWFDQRTRAQMVTAGPPVLRNKNRGEGRLVELISDDGEKLVLAEFDVTWGDLMY